MGYIPFQNPDLLALILTFPGFFKKANSDMCFRNRMFSKETPFQPTQTVKGKKTPG